MDEIRGLLGQSYDFGDGNKIEITQIKIRDNNEQWVTYVITRNKAIPQKLVSSMKDFVDAFGHLFDLSK